MSTIKTFWGINVQHLKLKKGMTVKEALAIFQDDPNVEYAEPNYYCYATITPDDEYFENLWGIHNSGQTVNGRSGIVDADIDVPEAWDTITGSSNVIVAVIDSGVDYVHPDLSDNIWINQGEISENGIDDDGNGYLDDVVGWDFVDGDNMPLDSDNHGTHVAGTIAAVGNNSIGITGVSWSANIIVLRFLNAFGVGYTSDAIYAIEYANENGAHVINCSWGSSGYSQALKDAIDASPAVVVCAAGNTYSDNDTDPHYPSSYESSNIIAVAATNQDDELASFSNYGMSSVDVAAPGTNIYSTVPARQIVWSDSFSDGDISDWETGGTSNTWGITGIEYFSDFYSLTDSPTGDYLNNTDSWARFPTLDLSTSHGVKLEMRLRGNSETNFDYLTVETSTDLSTWTKNKTEISGDIYTEISGSFSSWYKATVDLGACDGNSTVYIRFHFTSSSSQTYDGWYIDNISVTAASSSYSGTEYQFLNGTSMAAPHVSGLASLIKAHNPALTNTEIKATIENNVDSKDTLSGKIATGGRINAYNSFISPQAPSSLSATTFSVTQIDLGWIDDSQNEIGFVIERKLESEEAYSQIATVSANANTYRDNNLSGATTYSYRIYAYNAAGNSTYSNEASAITSIASSGGGGCFIATAAYGSMLHPHVKILCKFRDTYLLPYKTGKRFVTLYYRYSPPIAKLISGHDWLRKMTRVLIVPLLVLSVCMLYVPFLYALLVCLFVISGILIVLRRWGFKKG
ncbi:MAG: S8 family serine peptidase [Thermodesulfobacteriota bacterium]|nr:S8 family serine peptidase [Thermodesulfobacteriota bacterium]